MGGGLPCFANLLAIPRGVPAGPMPPKCRCGARISPGTLTDMIEIDILPTLRERIEIMCATPGCVDSNKARRPRSLDSIDLGGPSSWNEDGSGQ